MYLFSRYNSKRFKKLGKTFVIIEYYSIFWTSDPEDKGEHLGHYRCSLCPVKGLISDLWQKEGDFHVSAIWMYVTGAWKGSTECRTVENTSALRLPSGDAFASRLYPCMLKESCLFKKMLIRQIYLSSTS